MGRKIFTNWIGKQLSQLTPLYTYFCLSGKTTYGGYDADYGDAVADAAVEHTMPMINSLMRRVAVLEDKQRHPWHMAAGVDEGKAGGDTTAVCKAWSPGETEQAIDRLQRGMHKNRLSMEEYRAGFRFETIFPYGIRLREPPPTMTEGDLYPVPAWLWWATTKRWLATGGIHSGGLSMNQIEETRRRIANMEAEVAAVRNARGY